MIRIAIPADSAVNNYTEGLVTAGEGLGIQVQPVLVKPEGMAEEGEITLSELNVSSFDALLLPGGGDVAPHRYGEENEGSAGISEELDELQFSAMDRFVQAKKPVLGICRGHQLVNVYFGGTLIQDLPEKALHTAVNKQDNRHTTYAVPGSFLCEIYGESLLSNSTHHQAADRLGEGLVLAGYADGGIVEALQHTSLPVISVQFHPERMMNGLGAPGVADGERLIRYFLEKLVLPNKQREVENSIRKKFHKSLFTPFAKGINEYDMIQPGDRIAVCISGGKDSMLMAKLFQELKRHNKFPFELSYIVMDPGYNPANRRQIEQNAKILGVPVTIFESEIFDTVYDIESSPCYLCARMRRGYLYSKAKELGCNKIALGHHFDDVIETILMGMLYGGQVQTMMPKLHSTNFEGMELIRPMYLIREEDIIHWRDYNRLRFLQCACRFTEKTEELNPDGTSESKRKETKELIARLKESNPYVEKNIFKSVENVNLSTVIRYKDKKGEAHSFLDEY